MSEDERTALFAAFEERELDWICNALFQIQQDAYAILRDPQCCEAFGEDNLKRLSREKTSLWRAARAALEAKKT